MSNWIVTRESRRGLAYRKPDGTLTDSRREAAVYADMDEALANSNDGDVIVSAHEPVQRKPVDIDAILAEIPE